MWMTIWTVTIAMALGFSFLATLLKDGATFAGMSANNPKRTLASPQGQLADQSSSGATTPLSGKSGHQQNSPTGRRSP